MQKKKRVTEKRVSKGKKMFELVQKKRGKYCKVKENKKTGNLTK